VRYPFIVEHALDARIFPHIQAPVQRRQMQTGSAATFEWFVRASAAGDRKQPCRPGAQV
jgi:hypothetical protein